MHNIDIPTGTGHTMPMRGYIRHKLPANRFRRSLACICLRFFNLAVGAKNIVQHRMHPKMDYNDTCFTYIVISSEDDCAPAIFCLLCGMLSYHPDDIKKKYCANCRTFHEIKHQQ